ncbi:HEAT repeat domain-containing protein [Nitrosococcus wardiae]|uniref:HEAT repeat domain-containing protein n=1 Tax=Nitrosococcus wardiae TaxID=1814290 RepID=A0A4P7C001_9GAMM|nr:HEAT repeat domain-containing protein [Nitrosococcus wardiae]QBQ54820.1 HEAT repeat domain-containing protein [Nitrosococcus wardiae]
MPVGKFLLLIPLFFIHSFLFAGETFHDRSQKLESISRNDGGLHLEVEQAPLEQIFRIIENETGIRLHASPMPQKWVTATCAGATLEVLKCVLGKEANLIYRYADKLSTDNPTPRLQDVWVLSSNPSKHRLPRETDHQIICGATEHSNNPIQHERQSVSEEEQIALSSLKQNEREKLSALARLSPNPTQREEALSRLALVDEADDESIRNILTEALGDRNPNVRAQAVSGLVRRNDPEKDDVLREALHDSDVGVRLMAVSNAGEDMALLEAALHDTDKIVRDLANMKLDQILRENPRQ